MGRRRGSRQGAPRWTARWRWAAAARTSCRRRSPRCTSEDPPDWPQIAALYGELARRTGSPVVELNRAAAVAEAGDAAARSRSSTASTSTATTTSTRRAPSCCAGSTASSEARAAYDRALALVHSDAERRFLEQRLAELPR